MIMNENNAQVNNAYLQFININHGNHGSEQGAIAFHTSNNDYPVERVRITQAGNIGIGTTNPSVFFQVGSNTFAITTSGNIGIGTTNPTDKLHISNVGLSTNLLLENTGSGGRKYSVGTTNNSNSLGGGNFVIYDIDATAARFIIDSSGNIGIGTTTPTVKLEVNGAIKSLNTGNRIYSVFAP